MSARAEEIASGGLVFLIMPGIPEGQSGSDFPGGFLFDFLGSSLMDLAHEVMRVTTEQESIHFLTDSC